MKTSLTILSCILFSFEAATQTLQFIVPTAGERVNCIVRYNNTIYIGGEFDSAGGIARPYLAAIDANSGTVLAWNPAPDNKVDKMIIVDSKMVVEGSFSNIAGSPRNRICVFDLLTGNLLNSNIGWQFGSPDGLHHRDNYVYYCNSDSLGSYAMRRFNINTLQDDPSWKSSDFGFPIIDNITSHGNYIYAAGDFDIFNGSMYIDDLCRFNLSDGALDTSFHFVFTGNGYLYGVVAHNGKIYVTGNFDHVDGIARNGVAEIDTAGFVTSMNIYCSNHLNKALTLQGNTIWIGGNSVAIGGMNRYSIAQVDLYTGFATCWLTMSFSGNVYLNSIWASNDTVYGAPYNADFKAFTGNPGYVNIGNDTILCAGSSVVISAPAGLTNYVWSTGATTQSITVTVAGSYWFSADDPGGCLVSGYRVFDACTGIENEPALIPVQISPSISQGIYSIQFPMQHAAGIIKLYDLKGALVHIASIPVSETKVQLNISSLRAGMYFCHIAWGNRKSPVFKLVKE